MYNSPTDAAPQFPGLLGEQIAEGVRWLNKAHLTTVSLETTHLEYDKDGLKLASKSSRIELLKLTSGGWSLSWLAAGKVSVYSESVN